MKKYYDILVNANKEFLDDIKNHIQHLYLDDSFSPNNLKKIKKEFDKSKYSYKDVRFYSDILRQNKKIYKNGTMTTIQCLGLRVVDNYKNTWEFEVDDYNRKNVSLSLTMIELKNEYAFTPKAIRVNVFNQPKITVPEDFVFEKNNSNQNFFTNNNIEGSCIFYDKKEEFNIGFNYSPLVENNMELYSFFTYYLKDDFLNVLLTNQKITAEQVELLGVKEDLYKFPVSLETLNQMALIDLTQPLNETKKQTYINKIKNIFK